MDWSNERYVRLYTRDTPEWTLLSWEARGLFALLLRVVDRAGVIDLGKAGPKSLASLLRAPPEVVDRVIAEWTADGCVELHGSTLVIPNFLEAQEATQSDKTRQAESRARRRDAARLSEVTKRDEVSQNVTERHELSRAVTGGHAASQTVTPSLAVPCLAVPSEPNEEALSAGADDNGGQTPLLDVVSSPTSDSPVAFQALWNETAHPDLPRWRAMTPKRRQAAAARLRARPLRGGDTSFQAVIRRINNTSFCLGANKTGWRASPDWLLQPDTADKVLEGKYDRPGERVDDTGPPEPRDAAEALWVRVLAEVAKSREHTAAQIRKLPLLPELDGNTLILRGAEPQAVPWLRETCGQLLGDVAAQLNINLSLEDCRDDDTKHVGEAEDGQRQVLRAQG